MQTSGLALAVLGALVVPASVAVAAPMSLASHRAVYDLTLTESAEGSDVADVSGRLVMEFTGSECAGYTSKLRFVTESENPDGGQQITDSRSTTFESGDGKNLKFDNETYTDETLAEQSSGTASREPAGVAVDLTKPATKKIAVPGGVVFPAEQMEMLIQSAAKGESFVHLDVYDGSEDGETVFETAGVIGKVSTAADDIGEEKAVATAGIAGMRHWPLTISYFDKKASGDAAPFYVLSFVVYENGIGRTLKIDYGDFTLAGKLTGLELLPSAPCP
jgi:hypothetical protein